MADSEEPREVLPALIFAIDGQRFSIDAREVDTVIGWREPAELPGGHPWVWGVLQDRGRVVTVLKHPFSGHSTPAPSVDRSLRILVCNTSVGHLGLVATDTFDIEGLPWEIEPQHGANTDSTRGPTTHVVAQTIADEVIGADASRRVG